MITDFSAMSGGTFLLYYGALVIAAVVAGLWLPAFLRPDGRHQQVSDQGQLAWLASGPGGFTEATLARLFGTGALEADEGNKLRVSRADAGDSEPERLLTAGGGVFGISEAHRMLKPYAARVEDELIERDLVLDKGARWQLRLAGAAPYLAVLAVGWYRRQAGEALGEPTGFLTALMALTALLMLWRLLRLDPRTRAGQAALGEAKIKAARLRSAATGPELGIGVALFGTAILAGTPYSQLHAMRTTATGDGAGGYAGDGGDSVGDGGSGCGGGCGGCGG